MASLLQHRWEDSGRKKGFGYMEFEEYEAAQAALGLHTICGVELEVKDHKLDAIIQLHNTVIL